MSSAVAARLHRLSRGTAFLVIAVAATNLAGWMLDSPWLRALLPQEAAMKANTAVALVLGAVSLLLLGDEKRRAARQRLGRACAVLVLAIAAFTLAEYCLGWNLGIDELLVREGPAAPELPFPGRMSLLSVFNLALLGSALLLLDWRGSCRATQNLAGLALLLSLLALLGYTFLVRRLYTLGLATDVSLPAALGCGLLALGVLLARSDRGWLKVLSSDLAGGLMLRRQLPFVLASCWFFGWLSLAGSHAGLYSTDFDQLLVSAPLIFLFAIFLYFNARALNQVDAQRQTQSLELERLNADLEDRVVRRTAELERANAALLAEMAERQRAEEVHRRLAAILEATPDFVKTATLDGRVLYCNDAARRLRGLEAGETPSRFTIHDNHPAWAADLILKQGIPTAVRDGFWQGETAMLAPDGAEIPVSQVILAHRSASGEVDYVSTIARDISERKRAEEALRLNELRLEALLRLSQMTSASLQAIAEFALEEACRLSGSELGFVGFMDEKEAVLTLHAWSKGAMQQCQVVEKPLTFAVGPTGLWAEPVRRHAPVIINDYPTPHPGKKGCPEGHVPLTRYLGVPILEGGRVVLLAGMGNKPSLYDESDVRQLTLLFTGLWQILQRKRAEEKIRDLNAGLERRVAERTAELEESNRELESFTYSVSHDLRAPLRHIDGFSRVLLEEFGQQLDTRAQHYLQRVREGAARMGCLVDDLLNLARVGRRALDLQIVSLDSLVAEVRRDLEPECAGRRVEWRIGRLPCVECDPSLMKQVFANLLSNALKFTRPRERTVIEVDQTVQDGRCTVFVRDNGVGFSSKYADKLFGIFQRLHRQEDFEGTGVGLATVQRILRKHEGSIWAEAQLDRGATFYFTLSTAAQPAAKAAVEEAA